MNNLINFLLKIIIFSWLISLMLKYLAPLVTIAPTNFNAAILVIGLPLIIALFLGWKWLNTVYS